DGGILATEWGRAGAVRFWAEAEKSPGYPPPWTSTIHGYFVPHGVEPEAAGVPEEFIEAGPGLHRLRGGGVSQRLLVEDGPGGRLYLRIAFRLVDNVSLRSILIASMLMALAIAVLSWLSYRIPLGHVLPVAFRLVDNVSRWSILIASTLMALAIAVLSWLSYRIARGMVLPVTAMAGEVSRWDPRQPDLEAIDPRQLTGEVGSEVRMLGGAL